MRKTSPKRVVARVFNTVRSQAVRLPKEFRFDSDTVLVHREGSAVVLEPAREWPRAGSNRSPGFPAISAGPIKAPSRSGESSERRH